ncbi:MAG TPA: RES domain-containing protein [Steroidobacteraceae bacterium]
MSAAREVWRIAPDTPDYGADDLSGKGAERTGGRWNRKGAAMLYCSSTIALACLETFVNLSGAEPLPLNRYLVKITIPPAMWRNRTVLETDDHIGWDAQPAGMVSLEWGSNWSASGRSLIAEVPSVIVPEEANILINPRHRDARRLRARKVRRWMYDPRLARTRHRAH